MIQCKIISESHFQIFSRLKTLEPHHPIPSPCTQKRRWLGGFTTLPCRPHFSGGSSSAVRQHAMPQHSIHPLLLWWLVIGCTATGRSTATTTDVHTRGVLNFSIKATKLCRGFATTLFLGVTAVCTAASATKTTVKAKGSD